ncbi:uncharacterized protein PG998_009885 [Apiospora kogelbergensis]|uniref:uncharacterized protein n=1 Tax=Apiospora kogelbergensis TaxID=1337665 RepID=UPI00312E2CB2
MRFSSYQNSPFVALAFTVAGAAAAGAPMPDTISTRVFSNGTASITYFKRQLDHTQHLDSQRAAPLTTAVQTKPGSPDATSTAVVVVTPTGADGKPSPTASGSAPLQSTGGSDAPAVLAGLAYVVMAAAFAI